MMHKRTPARALGPAKLDRPRLERVYPRVRLFRALERARTRPLVWVSAPAGAGKTSLVGSYLAHKRERHIWYQVDAGDAAVDAADPILLSVSTPNLAPGRYTVRYRVLSVDGHIVESSFAFTVKAVPR